MGNTITVDVRNFYLYNIIDSCSISNLITSNVFYNAAKAAKCEFYCTKFITYECLYKSSNNLNMNFKKFQEIFKEEKSKGNFEEFEISIEDLQQVEILSKRMNLSKGELSSMVFAKKINQSFLTDDQGARKLASDYMSFEKVQTIPQLFGWLVFKGYISDYDKEIIIEQHQSFERPLKKYFEVMYLRALEYRLIK